MWKTVGYSVECMFLAGCKRSVTYKQLNCARNNVNRGSLKLSPAGEPRRNMSGIVTVETAQGSLRGKQVTTKDGFKYYSFKGIPFAKPPVGPLRFMAPLPPEPWSGVRDAFKDGAICAQKDMIIQAFRGDDDCLFLNVYTPKNPNSGGELKPVMVWFHGGGFAKGSGSSEIYGPDFLVAEDVIIVSPNYRIGPLGFLCLDNEKVPGNAGLKDQVMALRWVQQNIEKFGGDPHNVTIFGESAGGSSVHYHMLSPMSKGLYHRAISQSGTVLNWWAFTTSARDRTFRLGRALGCTSDNPEDLLEFLQKLPAENLVEANMKSVSAMEKRQMVAFPFVPCVEKYTVDKDVFLPAPPHELFTAGKFQHVPHIIGVNSCEGLSLLQDITKYRLEKIDSDVQCLLPNNLPFNIDTDHSQNIAKKMKEYYLGDKPISEDTKAQYANLTSDTWFCYPAYCAVKKQSVLSPAPTYFYKFCFDGHLGIYKRLLGVQDLKGVCHADDIGYLFHLPMLGMDIDKNSPEYKTLSRMVKLWTNFAKTGNPTPEITPLLDVTWKPVEKNKTNYLNIDETLSMQEDFEKERMEFWDSVYSSTNSTKAKL